MHLTRAVRASVAFAAVILWNVCGDGPDFGHYVRWAYAALEHDIFELRGDVLSPRGVPFNLASAGPGMLFTTVYHAFGHEVGFRTAAYLAGWIAMLVFWGCAAVVLRRAARNDGRLMLLGGGALFVGTHAGFYSHQYSTEIFANAFVAALWALAASPHRFDGLFTRGLAEGSWRPSGLRNSRLVERNWRLVESAAAGALAGLLLLVRPYLVVYAAAPLWLVVVARRGEEPNTRRSLITRMAVGAVPGVVAVIEYALVNRWMTGSPLRPPYVYGGFGFTSVDFAHPQLAAVLVHPVHGLLAYHPLYAVGALALAVQARRAEPGLRPIYVATLVAVFVHLWVQSSWYIWWLGGGSFGMRGMAPAALPLTAAIVAACARARVLRRPDDIWWIRAVALACAWSFPLLLKGNTQFATWSELVAAQRSALGIIGALVALWAALAVVRRIRGVTADVTTETAVTGAMLLAASVAYVVALAIAVPGAARTLAIALGVAVAAALVPKLRGRAIPWSAAAVLAVALAAFVTQAVLFARLAIATERHLASGAPPPRPFRYTANVPVDDLRLTYAEYLAIPGFEREKAAFRTFLNWQQIAMADMRPYDRMIAEHVLKTISADPVAGEMLVDITARNGIVTLSSEDSSAFQRARAIDLARREPGVADVDDRMK